MVKKNRMVRRLNIGMEVEMNSKKTDIHILNIVWNAKATTLATSLR